MPGEPGELDEPGEPGEPRGKARKVEGHSKAVINKTFI